jgi:hypothetical protein
MRLLSIGYPMPHRLIDNHTIFNAPTLFDYDAIIVDPSSMLSAIAEAAEARGEHLTHSELPVVDGETTDGTAGLGELLRRRRDEFARALDRGAIIVVLTHPQASYAGVSGFTGCDRYFWLPAPAGMGWDSSLLRGGEGTTAVIADHAHAFTPVIDSLRPDLLYRAYFDDRAHGFAAASQVFARSPGGAPIGVEFAVGAGSVVFLPTRRDSGGEGASMFALAIVEAVQTRIGTDDAETPAWVAKETVPGLAEREAATIAASDRLEAATAEVAEKEASADELRRVRDVLWRGGEHSQLPAVQRCLELLGFSRSTDDGPARMKSVEGELHLEIAASRESIDMAPHYRLRARLDEVIERERTAPRGLVVVNGERLREPSMRQTPYDDALRVAAEATRYAIVTTDELFAAAVSALGGADEAALAALRKRLLETDGVATLRDLLPAAAGETSDEEVASGSGE